VLPKKPSKKVPGPQGRPLPQNIMMREPPSSSPGIGLIESRSPNISGLVTSRSSGRTPRKPVSCQGPIQLSHGVSKACGLDRMKPTFGNGRALVERIRLVVSPGPHQVSSQPA